MQRKTDQKAPKRSRTSAEQNRQQAQFDQFLKSLDELLSGIVLSAESLDFESRRQLGGVLINKAHDVLVIRGDATVH